MESLFTLQQAIVLWIFVIKLIIALSAVESWCNMCEFCDFGIERKAIIDKQIDCGFLGGINISLAIDNDYSLDSNNYGDYILDFRTDNQVSLCAEYDEDYISDREKIKINFCPMCGRKLVEE